jgi:hypothetical protein
MTPGNNRESHSPKLNSDSPKHQSASFGLSMFRKNQIVDEPFQKGPTSYYNEPSQSNYERLDRQSFKERYNLFLNI